MNHYDSAWWVTMRHPERAPFKVVALVLLSVPSINATHLLMMPMVFFIPVPKPGWWGFQGGRGVQDDGDFGFSFLRIYRQPTGIQIISYRYADILQVYRHPTGTQASYRYTDSLQVYRHPEKYICCYINGTHKQYIEVDIIFNYIFYFGLPGACLYLSPQNTPFWRQQSRREMCISRICLKTCSWNSKMKNVVKYDVY